MSESDEKRNLPVTGLGFCICEKSKFEIFSKNLHLSFTDCYCLALSAVPTWDSNKSFVSQTLLKGPS